jgi:hypothetical protein
MCSASRAADDGHGGTELVNLGAHSAWWFGSDKRAESAIWALAWRM